MIRSTKALGIDLVDVFGAGRTRREPATLRHHFQTADGGAVSGRAAKDAVYFFTRQFCRRDLLG